MRRMRRPRPAVTQSPGAAEAMLALLARQKAEAERRMAIVDAAPPGWRDLVNRYPQDAVAQLSGLGFGLAEARAVLRRQFPGCER